MHRVGLPADDVPDAVRTIATLPGIEIEGAWSHLAVADEPDHPFTDKQISLFNDLVGQIERAGVELRFRHIANSAATIGRPDTHLDVVRCGIAAYGLWPSEAFVDSLDLRPAMALRARVGMVRTVPQGEAVSYGLQYELERTGRVITATAGYADGYDRRLSGIGDVLVRGSRFHVSGTICMDQFMVDVGDEDIEIGETATLIGADGDERVTAEELAVLIGTINYEVTARVPSRVPRVFVGLDDGA
jgi:alanine racemase